jgi:tetratricopeptide (TPR) repeat protein
MYTIAISALIGLLAGGIWTALDLWKSWQMGIVLFVFVGLGSFILISRAVAKRIEPRFLAIQKQIQANQIPLAMNQLEGLMPLGRWQILLEGQLHAQLGMLAYATQDEARAERHLAQAGYRATEAQLAYAALLYRSNRWAKAREVLDFAIRANKKQILPYHVYAWMLLAEGDRNGAIDKLIACQKIEPSNESTKENLSRLQNGKDVSMKRFGVIWYGLQLERPPKQMGQVQAAPFRKGFRQKPQRRS